ncbi:uncharacterized protein LOC128548567 [Mercenaria mercenaria]|uniref:uncharacterized protein LOC128548567 n=1 Tax=Mercenaria mercenaria TaxID=6596 RepID=UPI00234E8586|nr:uncharacterized protein LOC128548567 [Mercenaria mercenaria]
MASASYSAKLSESKYTNWVKAGLTVLFTKEGIEPFVDDEIKEFQQKCLTDICNNNGLPVGSTCFSCCTENVVVCPTHRICNSGRGRCRFHRNTATQYLPNGCPNKICHSFKNEIQHAHRFFGPSYKNTDATQWCSNSWEVAKCFMPPDGYKDATSAAGTDFNGINSVIINCKRFQSKINDNLGIKNNIFEKGRDIGRAVRHSQTLEVEDTDLNQYFTDLQTLLSDPGYLTADAAANNARKKLKELQNDTLVIDKEDIKKVLDDVAKAVQYRIKSESEKQQKNHEKQKLELIKEIKKSLLAIRRHKSISMSLLKRVVSSALSKIEESTKESLEKIHAQTQRGKKRVLLETEKSVKTIEEETERGKRKVIKTTDEGVATIAKATDGALEKITKRKTAHSAQKDADKYNKLQQDLQADLVTYYREKCKTIPVSPALEESEVPLSLSTR